jgi:hypothetical protein
MNWGVIPKAGWEKALKRSMDSLRRSIQDYLSSVMNLLSGKTFN